jgi:hypothetical protein
VIFISLYCLILQSIVGLVLVFYLYGNHLVDSKMTLSLILCMVAVRIHTGTDFEHLLTSLIVVSYYPAGLSPKLGRLAV